jgi:Domain of unknown function (DUF4836)
MKNILCLFLLAGAFAAGAQTPNELFRHVPADADRVYHIKLDAIGAKTPWSTLSSLIKDRHLGTHKGFTEMDIVSLMNSGIDFHQDIVVAESNAFALDSPRYFTVIVHLTDSGKLAAFLRAKAKEANGEPIHFIHVGKERVAVHDHDAAAWTDRLAVLLVHTPPIRPSAEATPAPYQAKTAHRCAAALRGFADTWFLTDPRVATVFADDADIHIWNRHTGIGQNLAKMFGAKAGSMAGLSSLIQKANQDAIVSSLSFQQGKIVFHSLRLLAPGEKTTLQRIAGDGLSHELAATLPPGEIMGLVTTHFDVASWADSIGKTPYAGMFTDQLQKKGLTLQDLPKALKGDFMILAYNPDKNAPGTKKMPNIYAAVTIGDKDTFTRLAKAFKLADAAAPDETTDTTATDTTHHHMAVYYGLQGDLAVIAFSRDNVNAFFNHPAAAANPGARLLTPQVYNNSFTLGLDMQAAVDFLTPLLTKADTISSHDKEMLDAVRKVDLLHFSTGAIHDDMQETNMELRMTDPNKNALASFVEIVAGLSKK